MAPVAIAFAQRPSSWLNIDPDSPFGLLVVCQVALAALSGAIFLYRQRCHNASKRAGFLRAYRQTRRVRAVPVLSVLVGGLAMLPIATFWGVGVTPDRIHGLQAVTSAQALVAFFSLLFYYGARCERDSGRERERLGPQRLPGADLV